MKFVLHTGWLSPHVLPWAKVVADKLGRDNFRYLYDHPMSQDRRMLGWEDQTTEWTVKSWEQHDLARDLLLNAECLYSGCREVDVFEFRAQKGLKTFYGAERWLKPITVFDFRLFDCLIRVQVPGWVRMLVPSYRKMAKRFVRWIQNDPNGRVFAIGPWAKKDMLWLGVPESKIIPWGYFVAPSDQKFNHHCRPLPSTSTLKVLWVGRMLDWKRVDTIIRAVREVKARGEGERWSVQLTLVGDGPEKSRLQRLVTHMLRKINNSIVDLDLQPRPLVITFLPSQPIEEIRSIMRAHDVYVLSSDKGEGWGAALSEALEEGMVGIGTYEAGSSATMLPDSCLFHAGDWRRLARLLMECAHLQSEGKLRGSGIGDWSAEKAAERLLQLVG